MPTIEALLDRLPDPDVLGQSEYRAIYDLLHEAEGAYEEDSGLTPEDFLDAVLDEVEGAVRLARRALRGDGERAHIIERLEYLRGCLRAESISYSELAELQGLAEHIEPGDVELLEAAGVPEFPDDSTERAEYNANPECRE